MRDLRISIDLGDGPEWEGPLSDFLAVNPDLSDYAEALSISLIRGGFAAVMLPGDGGSWFAATLIRKSLNLSHPAKFTPQRASA